MVGRPSMPFDFAVKHGRKNWTKAELEAKKNGELKMDADNIVPSSRLPKELHKRFYEIVNEFEGLGILANVDGDAISRYVMSDYKYWQITDAIETVDFDDPSFSQYRMIQNQYHKQAQELAKELGMTMVSRSKIRVQENKDEEEPSEEEQLFGNAL